MAAAKRKVSYADYVKAQREAETTKLSPEEEKAFQAWVQQNKITDVDHPDSYYDYRGYYKAYGPKPVRYHVDHFTDEFKQHGHPTFSNESNYYNGGQDAGSWNGEEFHPTPEQLEDQYMRQTMANDPDLAERLWLQKQRGF
jgi:hypothetical protein